MQKLVYFLHLLCVLFALQTIAAEPAVAASLIEADVLSCAQCALDDGLSEDDGTPPCTQSLLNLTEIDIDKLLLPSFYYPLGNTTYLPPAFHLHPYVLYSAYWLDRPPQTHIA